MQAAQTALAVAEEQIDAMFAPEQVLPEQWLRVYRNEDLSPPARLFRAVFDDAMQVLTRYGGEDSAEARALVSDALDWIKDLDGRRYRITFRQVVEAALPDCDADALSEKIVRVYHSFKGTRLVKMRLVQRYRGPRMLAGGE